jgi:hypothetical protein
MTTCMTMKAAKKLTERRFLRGNPDASLDVEAVAREVFANHPGASGSFDGLFPSHKEPFIEAARELISSREV